LTKWMKRLSPSDARALPARPCGDVVGYFAEASVRAGATGYGRGTTRGFHGRDGVDEGVNLRA